jgi:long-chain acyl-CoA synthetase
VRHQVGRPHLEPPDAAGPRRPPGRRWPARAAAAGPAATARGESPYAVVVLRPGAHLSKAEVITWTRDRLAHFKCPVGVSFTASLTWTASGKLQKQAIRTSPTSPAVP